MNFTESGFEITENNNCPFYQKGDHFKVFGRGISLKNKPTCLTLMSDLTEVLINCQSLNSQRKNAEQAFNCSGYQTGCPGTIRLRILNEKSPDMTPPKQIDRELSDMAEDLKKFSIFKTLSESDAEEIISYFKIKKYQKGQIILRKGDRGENLFIILSGKIDIIGNYGISITGLTRGEIFGEMSLLTGNPISTKVKVVEDTKVLYITGSYFRMMLNRFPSLQMYFIRLLVRRVAQSNIDRSKEFTSGIAGNLSEINFTELLQALNLAQKTGALTISLPKGEARISFKNGDPINVEYNKINGEDAFFEILKHKRGNFKFVPGLLPGERDLPKIGDFMYLMMEGMNRIDEASEEPIILDTIC